MTLGAFRFSRGGPMELNCNFIVDESALDVPKEGIEATIILEVSGVGLVYVFNCTPVEIASISINNTAFTLIPPGSNPGEAPQCVAVNRFGNTPPIFGPSTQFAVTFIDGQAYSQTVKVNQPAPASVSLWCFYTGLVLTDPYGRIRQISWGF